MTIPDLAWVEGFLARNPAFKRKLIQWTTLHDAAEILDQLQPPAGQVAAKYLREIGDTLLREAGVPEDVLGHMTEARPSVMDLP